YILRSKTFPQQTYVGHTTDLEKRMKKHNSGGSPHTSKYKPWKIQTAIFFREKEKALEFEKYLKSHSGRAFTSKHF
ncbi:MAG: GIY-YIG nuclease family protein, partial [Ignavibacteriae bacterium]|nr:GIY-YIG nuclease family protein [Ignavibacteriota bacterium]